MQSALQFYKAKLHIYDPKSPQSKNKKPDSNSSLYRFCSEPKNYTKNLHQRSKTESVPYQDQIFNDSSVRLSVWNLQSNRLERKQKTNSKNLYAKNISIQQKTYKVPSNYLTGMQIKKKLQKDHYMHKYRPKNIDQIQINKIQPKIPSTNKQNLKVEKSSIADNKLCPKLGYAATFSQRFKEYKRSLGSLQMRDVHLLSNQQINSLSYTLSLADMVSKRSQSLFVNSFMKKSTKKIQKDENLQAWTDRSHKDDGIQLDIISRKKIPSRPKSKGMRTRQTKSFVL